MRKYPASRTGRQTFTFHPAPFRAPLRAFAALVFPWRDGCVLLCDIADRGWCVPSGRVEPDESSEEAARREALEEAGAIVDHLQYIGCFRIAERNEVRWADCFTATVPALVEITAVEESRARRFATLDETERLYYAWNPLTEQVFLHSLEVACRLSKHRGDAQ